MINQPVEHVDVHRGLSRARGVTAPVRANAASTAHEPEAHTAGAHAVIAAELVACTLGQRQRPELRVDLADVLATFRTLARRLRDAFAPLHPCGDTTCTDDHR